MYTEVMKSHKHLHPIKRWKSLGIDYKVLSCALVIIVIAGGLFGFAKIQDHRNEQFLRQIVADFDTLESELEQATGVEVEDKSGCFTTSEKFGEGKTGCFTRIEARDGETDLRETIIEKTEKYFIEIVEFKDGGYSAGYMGERCLFIFNEDINYSRFSIDCPVPVRSGNSDLTKAIF